MNEPLVTVVDFDYTPPALPQPDPQPVRIPHQPTPVAGCDYAYQAPPPVRKEEAKPVAYAYEPPLASPAAAPPPPAPRGVLGCSYDYQAPEKRVPEWQQEPAPRPAYPIPVDYTYRPPPEPKRPPAEPPEGAPGWQYAHGERKEGTG